ncbi:MAG TPA: ABC transporter ATP-binding protein [Kiritimatiellia bacterium]|nr:ABC transporter ATP-binding protein [Kiritimatiellia bacterium]
MPPPAKPLKDYVAPYRTRATLGFLSVVGAIALGLIVPFILRNIIDGIESGEFTARKLHQLVAMFFAASAAAVFFSVLMRKILLGVAQHVEYDIRKDVFNALTRLDFAFFQRERTGDIMTKMSSDLGAIRELVGQGLLQGSRIALGFPFAFGIMFALNVKLALTIMLIIPVISIVFFFIIRVIRRRYDISQEQFSTISNFCQESFAGFRTIKGFGIEERMRGRFREQNEEYIRRNMSLTRAEEPVWPFMIFMFGMGTLLLLLVGGRLVIEGQMSLGEFVQFNQYLLYLQWPMLALGWTSNLIQRGLASWKRVQTILGAVPDIADGPHTRHDLTTIQGDIRFEDVSLTLGGTRLLHNINLVIPEGQTLAITGPTGGGKTLLVSLIQRLIDPTEGRITLGGIDLRHIPLKVLRASLGVAPQETFLFSDTLANNISLGLPAAETSPPASSSPHEEKVLWAACIAHLRDEVEGFPNQFQTMLGERGVTLSGGQRQRTAISRALALDPRILILDDVFSAVDTHTEARILEQLLPVLGPRTSILISHRVSTLRHADRILVLDEGAMIEEGSHEELVARGGYYADLDETQRLEARLEEGAS